jgi:predicted RNA-binding protein YlxR (DUF448 family)/ribosomal protein L7Ae-like RNA K-turn-binding protein
LSTARAEDSTRTCVGCRQKDGRLALLRFVLAGDPPTIVPDLPRRGAGRGVSIHPTRRCLAAAARNGGLGRGLRAGTPVDVDQLAEWARGQYARRFDGLLMAAYRAGHAVLGSDRVREAMASERASLLIVAADASERRAELVSVAERLGRHCIVHSDKATLGRMLGRETVAVIAITDLDIAMELQHATQCAALLAEAS